MINLAVADLAHILSLPLRIYYYFTHTWPFGQGICLFCFYLKYLNMYAAIAFLVSSLLSKAEVIPTARCQIHRRNSPSRLLISTSLFSRSPLSVFYFIFPHHQVCISAQRCVFLLHPFYAKRWRRRYEVLISLVVWMLVSLGCSPFILMRSSSSSSSGASSTSSLSLATNESLNLDFPSTQGLLGLTRLNPSPLLTVKPAVAAAATPSGCFKDLPMRRLSIGLAATMMAVAELVGFIIPLVCISYSSIRITHSLRQSLAKDQQQQQQAPGVSSSSSTRCRLQSVSSNGGKPEGCSERLSDMEKRRALRMVLGCFILFVVCFVPYHVNFLLYLMVSQGVLTHCGVVASVRRFHPVSLCLASLSSCLNPLLYYFLTVEFRQHLARRVSSMTSSLLSSPISSNSRRLAPHRLMSMESSCSDREEHH